MARTGIRAVAILIKDGKILLIKRKKSEEKFWVFPGGGKEDNETPEEAVVREVEEETSIICKTDKLLYTHELKDLGHRHLFYHCKYVSGNPKLGNYNEAKTMKNEDQTYEPVWININELPNLLLYPLEIRDWLVRDYPTNFKDTPRTAVLKSTDLRQEM